MGGIGESLRSTREAKGISLEQAEEDTKIRKRYLQALEDGEYDVIPGRVYAKGFLRNYATYLGLDQEEVMLEYKLLGVPAKEEYKRTNIETSINKRRSSVRADRKTYLATVLIAVFAVLVLVVYNFAFKDTAKNSGNPGPDRSATEQGDKAKPADKTKTADKTGSIPPTGIQSGGQNGNSASPSLNNSGAGNSGSGPAGSTGNAGSGNLNQNASGVNLTLNGMDEVSWARVTVDGVVKFTGNINPGDSKTFSGTDKIIIRVGNAGAVEANLNGQSLGKLGSKGQPVTREFGNANPAGGSSGTSAPASGGASGGTAQPLVPSND